MKPKTIDIEQRARITLEAAIFLAKCKYLTITHAEEIVKIEKLQLIQKKPNTSNETLDKFYQAKIELIKMKKQQQEQKNN